MKLILIFMSLIIPSLAAMDHDPIEPITKAYEPIFNLTYPPEAFAYILKQLSFKDQQALTSSCTYLRNFSIHAKALHPLMRHTKKRTLTRFGAYIMTAAGLCSILSGGGLIKAIPAIIPALSTGFFIGFPLALNHHRVRDLFTKEKTPSPQEKIDHHLYMTQAYKNLAQRMALGLITADALHIDYYHREQIKPVIEVIRTQKISSVSLELHASAKKPFLLSSLLRDNNHLTHFSMELNGSYTDACFILERNDFTTTIKGCTGLTHLTLSYLDLTHPMLNALFSNRFLRTVKLLACATRKLQYDFQALINNRRLSSLSILYFTNLDTGIDCDTIIHLCNKSNLASLTIKSPTLTDEAILAIYANPRRPAELSVSDY